jgi:hypothetical protein
LLDILTDAGKETIAQEMRAAQIIENQWMDCHYLMTGKNGIATVDALIVRNWQIAAVAETKCRNMTLAQLRDRFNSEWLVTFDKILGGAEVARGLAVPFWGVLYLVPDDVVLRVRLFDPAAGWLVHLRVERTETQRSVNGGKALRSNAYISTLGADVLRGTK